MLVLTRERGQRIRIGDDITITLVSGSYNRARIGVEAPEDMPVHREEIYEAIKQRNEPDQRGTA